MSKAANPKKNKKKFHIGKFISISLLLIVLTISAIIIGITVAVVRSSPDLSGSIMNSLKQSSKIYDMNNHYIEDYSDSQIRSVVSLKSIPTILQNSFIGIEDERFRQHHGIDFKRIIGAVWVDIKTKSSAQGASTITQQLIKNTYLSPDKTFTRKIREAYLALQLERKLSKDQILEAYLNTIYLGGSSYGVEAAAYNYFRKDVSKLTLSECAFLAGLNKNPLKYYPYNKANYTPPTDHAKANVENSAKTDGDPTKVTGDKDSSANNLNAAKSDRDLSKVTIFQDLSANELNAAKDDNDPSKITVDTLYINLYKRRDIVLAKMFDLHMITSEEYATAKAEKLKFSPSNDNNTIKYQWFIEPAINQIAKDFSIRYGVEINEAKQKLRVGGYNIYLTIDPKIQEAAEKVINDASNYKGVRIPKSLKSYTSENTSKNPSAKAVVQPQAAAVIYDYTTGQMRAVVGGRGKFPRLSTNRATDVPRQPGSSLKPLSVYGPAIDSKIATPATIIEDTPMPQEFVASHGGWNPHNFETKSFSGPVTIRQAIMKSINIVAIKLANTINPDPSSGPAQNTYGTSINYLQNKFHLSTIKTTGANSDLSLSPLSLGALTEGVYPYEMAAAYGVFGNGGIYTTPIMYTKVTDNMGNTVLENSTKQSQSLSPQAAYVMIDLLKGVVTGGTGTRAKLYLGSMPAAGKTGTAADNTNLWFCGLTPYYSGALWLGHDKPKVPLKGLTSGTAAAMWGKIMKVADAEHKIKDFTRPPGIITEQVCIDSGKAPNEYCYKDPRGSRVRSEIFIDGTQPIEICDFHNPPKIIPTPIITTNPAITVEPTTTPDPSATPDPSITPDPAVITPKSNTPSSTDTGASTGDVTEPDSGAVNGNTGDNSNNATNPAIDNNKTTN